MFNSLEELEVRLRSHLDAYRFFDKQSWVLPRRTTAGEKIHDVAIVGAGQSGLALAYNLRLRGVRRLVVLDANDPDAPGPWWSFARMTQLRTPKAVPGPECGNPLLGFRAWFSSIRSAEEYDTFEFIPLAEWRAYLRWYLASARHRRAVQDDGRRRGLGCRRRLPARAARGAGWGSSRCRPQGRAGHRHDRRRAMGTPARPGGRPPAIGVQLRLGTRRLEHAHRP